MTKIRLPFTHSHIENLSGGYGLSSDMARFLNEIEDQPRYEGEDIRVWADHSKQEMEFVFKHRNAAALFKLTWTGL